MKISDISTYNSEKSTRDNGITALRVEANRHLKVMLKVLKKELNRLNYKCNVEMVSAPTLVARTFVFMRKVQIFLTICILGKW